jgi:radial spoke head protein 4A
MKEWIKLPLIRPEHIIVSKKMNTLLTGDLESSLYTYPIFPGKEKHYLKALIVRITNGSVIVPRGLYKLNDENRNYLMISHGN